MYFSSNFLFSKKNEEIIFMSETYPMYDVWCKLHNIKYKKWNFENNFKLNILKLKKQLRKDKDYLF